MVGALSLIVLGMVIKIPDASCRDGWDSPSIGLQEACSHHGGVEYPFNPIPLLALLLGVLSAGVVQLRRVAGGAPRQEEDAHVAAWHAHRRSQSPANVMGMRVGSRHILCPECLRSEEMGWCGRLVARPSECCVCGLKMTGETVPNRTVEETALLVRIAPHRPKGQLDLMTMEEPIYEGYVRLYPAELSRFAEEGTTADLWRMTAKGYDTVEMILERNSGLLEADAAFVASLIRELREVGGLTAEEISHAGKISVRIVNRLAHADTAACDNSRRDRIERVHKSKFSHRWPSDHWFPKALQAHLVER